MAMCQARCSIDPQPHTTRSASHPGASRPRSCRRSEPAPPAVYATSASAGDRPSFRQASERTSATFSLIALPGFRFEASASGTPAARSRRAGAHRSPPTESVESGRSPATTRARESAAIPASSTRSRWSAEAHPVSAASCAPPEAPSWSACRRGTRPRCAAASRIRRDSSAVNAPSSRNTSHETASRSRATVGRSWSQTSPTNAARSSARSGGTAWARKVGTIVISRQSASASAWMTRRSRSSFAAVSPYPLFTSTVVTPCASRRRARAIAAASSAASGVASVARVVTAIPPPERAVSRYGIPLQRRANSPARSPAKTRCVCESTRPGVTSAPPASRARASDRSTSASRSRSRPTQAMRRSSIASAPPGRSPASEGPRSQVASTALRTTRVAFGRRFLGAGIRGGPGCAPRYRVFGRRAAA